MAALQGKGAFGAPPLPVAPKPVVERPKWKPPPVVHAPQDDDDDQGIGSSIRTRTTGASAAAGIAAAVERSISPPSIPKSSDLVGLGASAEDTASAVTSVPPDGGGNEGEAEVIDPEEQERQRRAAIAARMARLGGARVGMAPPLFGPKPPVRRPTQDEPPKEAVKAPEPEVQEAVSAHTAEPTEVVKPEVQPISPSLDEGKRYLAISPQTLINSQRALYLCLHRTMCLLFHQR